MPLQSVRFPGSSFHLSVLDQNYSHFGWCFNYPAGFGVASPCLSVIGSAQSFKIKIIFSSDLEAAGKRLPLPAIPEKRCSIKTLSSSKEKPAQPPRSFGATMLFRMPSKKHSSGIMDSVMDDLSAKRLQAYSGAGSSEMAEDLPGYTLNDFVAVAQWASFGHVWNQLVGTGRRAGGQILKCL